LRFDVLLLSVTTANGPDSEACWLHLCFRKRLLAVVKEVPRFNGSLLASHSPASAHGDKQLRDIVGERERRATYAYEQFDREQAKLGLTFL
jgi:hypothetical protein